MNTVTNESSAALPLGFEWGAVKAGIKASGNLDLAVAIAPNGANAAAMFTTNQLVAAPVTVGRRHMAATGGRISTVLVNAGNANCATGAAGIEACMATCVAAAESFHCVTDEVFPSSTGIIGVPFPVEKVVAAMPAVKASMGSTAEHAELFARAIMTTDTKMKVSSAVIDVDGAGRQVRIFGAAKGAGMIHPQLGPAARDHAGLYLYGPGGRSCRALRPAAPGGRAQLQQHLHRRRHLDQRHGAADRERCQRREARRRRPRRPSPTRCRWSASRWRSRSSTTARASTTWSRYTLRGARDAAEAKKVAKSIAHSPLCKTAWSSGDPNWGRLMAATGYSGVTFDPEKVKIFIGPHLVFADGLRVPSFDKAATHETMMQREYTIAIDLGQGEGECRFLTCDLTAEYVAINADYSS